MRENYSLDIEVEDDREDLSQTHTRTLVEAVGKAVVEGLSAVNHTT
jgi:hypothetical protein